MKVDAEAAADLSSVFGYVRDGASSAESSRSKSGCSADRSLITDRSAHCAPVFSLFASFYERKMFQAEFQEESFRLFFVCLL